MTSAPDLAAFAAQALDCLVAQAIVESFEAVCAAGERDYSATEDIAAIHRMRRAGHGGPSLARARRRRDHRGTLQTYRYSNQED
jgi:hypothetical protein